jgi:hypothetical protein
MKTAIRLFIFSFLFSGMIQAQEKATLNVKDLNSGIEKYIKKNYEGYKAVEAFKHEVHFEMKTQKGDASVEWLLFDKKGKFLKRETGSMKDKMPSQMRTTMATKDVESDITKYIKKSECRLTEAYMYDEAYEVKIMKGNDSQSLIFDKEGKFVMKAVAPIPSETKKTDSVPTKKEEPQKADTTKK